MIFEERTVAGEHTYWPKPEIFYDEQDGLLIVATPWGARSRVKPVMQIVTDYFMSSRTDREVTSPFSRFTNVSSTANNLRVALLLANEAIYNEDNKEQYTFGVEILVAHSSPREFSWAQIGHPHVWLNRPSRGLLPMVSHWDLPAELSTGKLQPPLPKNILGLDPYPSVCVNSFRPNPDDQIILINHSWPPLRQVSSLGAVLDIESLVDTLASGETHPFWLGLWSLG